MSKNLQSPTKLTEFAPLQPEEKQQSVGQFISKFFKLGKSPINENAGSESSDTTSHESTPSRETSADINPTISTVYPVDVNEGRSLPNVLKRISNLLALKTTNLQAYGDTELKQYWMPDSVSKECYECCEKFTTFRRRHHCRVCGQIFCSQCCNEQIPGKIFGCTGDLRVCTYCCKVVLSYLQSSDVGTDLTADLKVLQESLLNKFGPHSMSATLCVDSLSPSISTSENLDTATMKRKISVGYQEEKFISTPNVSYLSSEEKYRALQNSVSLRNLYEEICRPTTGVSVRSQRFKMKTYTDCFLGSDLVDWLIYQQRANTRIQACTICQALLEGGYIEYILEPGNFIDGYALYRLGNLSSFDQPRNVEIAHQDEPSWVQQIPQESSTTDSDNELSSTNSEQSQPKLVPSSSYALDLNIEASTVYLSRPPPASSSESENNLEKHRAACEEITVVRTSEQRELVPKFGWHEAMFLREENGEKLAYNILTEAFKQHEQNLVDQLLSNNGLPLVWTDIIIPLVHRIVNTIRPDKNHDAVELDIRHYIQFKKVPSGCRSDTTLVEGIICSKNVVHKGMSTNLQNPKILLLQCSVVYQRTEGRLMSLDPILMQEHEYLRNVVARIVALQPNLVLVHRNVSRLAQDFLRAHNITLIHNVKQTVLERLSRCTQADIVCNVDAHIGRPKLGTCKRFYLKKYPVEKGNLKTLMFFEGLPMSHLGSTVLLRGASTKELVKAKEVASLCLFSSYNWRLEKSFLMDEFAQPPRDEFFEDSKENSPSLPAVSENILLEHTKVINTSDVRKTEANEDKKLSIEEVQNFSDPLHNLSEEGYKSSETEKLAVAELPFNSRFRKALHGTILSVSPYIVFPVPYLETELGKKCKLRAFFPDEIYYSKQFVTEKKIKCTSETEHNMKYDDPKRETMTLHPFLKTKITNVDDNYILGLLADFRACGGRYQKKPYFALANGQTIKDSGVNNNEESDVFDLKNHQKLAVLFCSFSHESSNAPMFCVNPWVVQMDFYGCNDIPLGCFLERYCFRSTYTCPSKTCDTAMLNHTRRFVHNSGCVSISLKCLEKEFPEDDIVMWSFCSKCQDVSPAVPMSSDTWSYSFGKYLELMFYGNIYSRRGKVLCPHSLHHDLYQYFGYKNYVASFKYTPVNIWDISLPPSIVEINHNFHSIYDQLINEIKMLSLKGHELFSLILEKLHSISAEVEAQLNLKQLLTKEQLYFKEKIEEAQLQLTSPTLEFRSLDSCSTVLPQRILKIEDCTTRIKKMLVETVETWNWRLSEAARKSDKKREKSTQQELDSPRSTDDRPISSEYLDSDSSTLQSSDGFSGNMETKKNKSSDTNEGDGTLPSSPKSHQRSQSDSLTSSHNEELTDSKKDPDKKTVKTILSQLLPSSTNLTQIPLLFSGQEHYIVTGTCTSVVVYENEPSSIIAYALNSSDYKKSLEEFVGKKVNNRESTPSPNYKRKNNSDNIENGESTSSLLSFLRNKDSKIDSPGIGQTCAATESLQDQNSDDIKKGKCPHIEVQFQDCNCNFFCRVYFAERFMWLRSKVLPSGEEAYIRSLSRSIQWNARGGKSGSNFSKSIDDRFVLKEMSKNEVQLFIDWAPNYFTYMERCITSSQPTLLGKILGIYQIIFKNNSTNVTLRTNLLVMENLFYNKIVSQKFDLKGSVRNRLVNPSNQTGEIVLLDENLLKMTCDSPLYILPHSKAVLMTAIQNDTEFLSLQSVMDYSLLVGLDTENRELVLGIIDYIRTFTWDKKLETMVKKSGILGGQGKLPTIVSPEEYQKRFIEAMHRYFLEVPDHWAGLGKGVQC